VSGLASKIASETLTERGSHSDWVSIFDSESQFDWLFATDSVTAFD
jgi:hypothetical protein